MALIKCINCGHMISDKAVKCPKCGTPIQMIKEAAKPIEKEEKVIAEVETPKAEIAKSEAVVPDEPKSQTWKKVCGIFVFAVIVIVGGYYYIQNEKSNSKSEEEIAQLNSEAFLEDGEYCYKGKWESAQHAAQPCKVEFIIKNGALIDCAYTNLKFNVRIPLKGTIEDNNLHFVSENDGKLIIELKLSDNGMMLIGEGTDYAHSGDKARLNLSKIELDAVYNEQMNEEQELFECQTDQIREEYNKLKTQEVPEDYCSADDHCLYYAIDPHNKLSASKMIDYPMTFVYGGWDDYNSKGVAYQLQQYGVPQNKCRESVRKLGFYSFSYHDDRVIHWWEQKIFMYEGIYIRRMTSSYDYYSYTTYGEKIEIVHEAVNKFENELQKRGINFSDNRNRAIWKTPSRIAYYRDRIIVIEVSEYKGQQGAPDENITYGTIDIHILKKSVYDKRSESNIIYE